MTPEEAQAAWESVEIPTPDQGRLAFARFLMNGRPHELRVLGSKIVSGIYATPEELASAAAEADGLANVYVTANPVSLDPVDAREVGAGDCAGDDDIARIRWFAIDLDCYDDPDQLLRLKEHLDGLGWPQPLVMASGGGYWLLYRYDGENTLKETRLRERALRTLKTTFPAVDTSVSNASRIVRFAYTRNLKQHRMSYLVTPHDAELEPLQRQQLEGVAGGVGPEPEPKDGVAADRERITNALGERGITLGAGKPARKAPGEIFQLSKCPFYPEKNHRTAATLTFWNDGNISFGCLGDTCVNERHGILDLLELLGMEATFKRNEDTKAIDLVSFTSVRIPAVAKLWDSRIIRNDITPIVGNEGEGKGTTLVYLIGEIASGRLTGHPERVVYASTEEVGFRTALRLRAAGVPLDMVATPGLGSFELPTKIPALAEALTGRGARWLVLDPINKHFGTGYDPQKPKDVGFVMGELRKMAVETDITILGSLHTIRRSSSLQIRDNVAHSIEFLRESRSALLITADPDSDDPGNDKILFHAKHNYSAAAPALQARFDYVDVPNDEGGMEEGVVVLRIVGETAITEDELFLRAADKDGAITRARRTAYQKTEAKNLIYDRWVELGRPAEAEASAFSTIGNRFSKDAMSRARLSLGVLTEPIHDGRRIAGHRWRFPKGLT